MKKLYHRIKDPLGLHARPAAKLAESRFIQKIDRQWQPGSSM